MKKLIFRIKSVFTKLFVKKKKEKELISISRRDSLQTWTEGREDVVEAFYYEDDETFIVGIEVSGVIYYCLPGEYEGIVFICLENTWKDIINRVGDMSEVRFRHLGNHLPTFNEVLCDSILSSDPRLDRGAIIPFMNRLILCKKVDFDFKGRVKNEGILLLADEIIVNSVKNLIDINNQMLNEFDSFNGFGFGERLLIEGQELLNNVKMGLKIQKYYDAVNNVIRFAYSVLFEG